MSSVTGHAMSSGPAHSKSRPENAATTPSMARAFDTSTPFTFACAYGLRTTAIHSIPCRLRSSVYLARPVRNSGSSLRRTGLPTDLSVIAISAPPLRPRAAHLAGGVEDRLHDVVVAGAAAQVALEGLAHLLFRGIGVLVQIALRGHHHARRAVPALQPVVAMKRFLDRMQLTVGRQALDRRDLAAVRLCGKKRARLHGLSIEQDRACAARGCVATDIRPREFQCLPEEIDEQRARFDIGFPRDPVDGDRDMRHGFPFPARNVRPSMVALRRSRRESV